MITYIHFSYGRDYYSIVNVLSGIVYHPHKGTGRHNSKKYHGFIDMGTDLDDDCLPVVKETLTFIVVSHQIFFHGTNWVFFN